MIINAYYVGLLWKILCFHRKHINVYGQSMEQHEQYEHWIYNMDQNGGFSQGCVKSNILIISVLDHLEDKIEVHGCNPSGMNWLLMDKLQGFSCLRDHDPRTNHLHISTQSTQFHSEKKINTATAVCRNARYSQIWRCAMGTMMSLRVFQLGLGIPSGTVL